MWFDQRILHTTGPEPPLIKILIYNDVFMKNAGMQSGIFIHVTFIVMINVYFIIVICLLPYFFTINDQFIKIISAGKLIAVAGYFS